MFMSYFQQIVIIRTILTLYQNGKWQRTQMAPR